MDENAWVLQTLAGACFLAAGIPLLRLASRSGQLPERVLGWTFLFPPRAIYRNRIARAARTESAGMG